jgi:glutaredoxin-related protein
MNNTKKANCDTGFAKRFVRVLADADKMARGEKPLPHNNIDEALKRWQKWAEEV